MSKDAQVSGVTPLPPADGVTLWKESVSGRKLSPAATPGYHLGRRPGNAGRRYPVDLLSPAEVRMLMDCCPPNMTGTRNRALIAILYRTGLRISEALSLTPSELDAVGMKVTVLRAKGGTRRIVGMDPAGWEFVEAWLETRRQCDLTWSQHLICTMAGAPVKPSYVRALLPRLARNAGITKRVHAHGLRHSHAVELAREGVPLHLIQRQLGHRSLATTDTYLRGISSDDIVAALSGRSWPA